MTRPRTKSEPIQFRLSLEAYAEAERRAARHSETVNQYLARQVERSLTINPSAP
jgi:hypothetical protein